jgi:hypothetical protein
MLRRMNDWTALVLLTVAAFDLGATTQDLPPSGTGQTKQIAVSASEEKLRKIGEIDFFGYGDLNPARLRDDLPIQQGQSISQGSWHSVQSQLDESIKEDDKL